MNPRPPSSLWSETDLERAYSSGKKAWPELALSLDLFGGYLTQRILSPTEAEEDSVQDLYLACACAHDIPGALPSFRARYFASVLSAAKSFDASPAFAEEVYQRLSETLFVGGGQDQGKIARYSGRGPLAGFITTSAKRIALRYAASFKPFQGEAQLVKQFSQFTEQETALMKVRYRETFNSALSIALRRLPERERLVLRMNLVERVSTTRIARLYKVSQPTVSRWIQRTSRHIFTTVKDLVCDELAIDTREMESLLLLVRSQIEITLSLAGGAGATVEGQDTCELSNGGTLALRADRSPPFRLLLLQDGRPVDEWLAGDRAALEAPNTVAAVAARSGAPNDEVSEALRRLADLIED